MEKVRKKRCRAVEASKSVGGVCGGVGCSRKLPTREMTLSSDSPTGGLTACRFCCGEGSGTCHVASTFGLHECRHSPIAITRAHSKTKS